MGELRTIGVYGFDDVSFLDGLTRDGITMLLDVRQRRGVQEQAPREHAVRENLSLNERNRC